MSVATDDDLEVGAPTRPVDSAPAERWRGLPGWLVYLAVVAVQVLVYLPMVGQRILDGDEGFYALATKLVEHGHLPYVDFWFQHMPLLPFVYGPWGRIFGETFYSLRMLSALLTAATGLLLYIVVKNRFESRLYGYVGVLLFASTSLVVIWDLTVKGYALATLFTFAAYTVVASVDRSEGARAPGIARWFAAGLLLALAIGVRLLFVGALPGFLIFAFWSSSERRERVRNLVAVAVGLAVGLLPSLYFFASGPRRFVADVLESQTTRSDLAWGDAITDKLRTAGALARDPQFLLLATAAILIAVLAVSRRGRIPLWLAIVVGLGLVFTIPTPSYAQYYVPLVPFLVLGALEVAATVRARIVDADASLARLCSVGSAVVVVLYLVVGAAAYDSFLLSDVVYQQPSDARAVSRVVDAHTRPGEVVLSFSPAQIYESHARQLPGVESDFAADVVANAGYSAERAHTYRALTLDDIERAIRDHDVRIIVLPTAPGGKLAELRPWRRIVEEAGYDPLATADDTIIYARPNDD